jgi:hypothetical protein
MGGVVTSAAAAVTSGVDATASWAVLGSRATFASDELVDSLGSELFDC